MSTCGGCCCTAPWRTGEALVPRKGNGDELPSPSTLQRQKATTVVSPHSNPGRPGQRTPRLSRVVLMRGR